MSHAYAIGIDPPQGWAVWDSKAGKFAEVCTFKGVEDTLAHLAEWKGKGAIVYCEDPRLNKHVWIRPGTSQAAMKRISRNVGMNQERARIIIDYARKLGYTVIPMRPSKRTMTKLTPTQFKTITGYTGRTSEHARDAAMYCYQR